MLTTYNDESVCFMPSLGSPNKSRQRSVHFAPQYTKSMVDIVFAAAKAQQELWSEERRALAATKLDVKFILSN